MNEPLRKPAVFRPDDPRLETIAADTGPDVALPESAAELMPAAPRVPARRMRWGAIFWSALSGLVLLGIGVGITNFVEELFSRAPWLGAVGLGLAVLAGVAFLAVATREAIGLAGLARVEALRERALAIIASDNRADGQALVADMLSLTHRIPRLARARARLAEHSGDIIDGRDLVRLAERDLMAPLDAEARRMIVAASKRVSLATAISPRAVVDMLFVLINALGLVRRLAVIYGARPGALGVLKLFRQIISHLAVTGGVAVSDSLLQQVIGHGVAARLSARLGEGMINGLLTARLGLLALDEVRPLPFAELPRPALNDLVSTLLRPSGGDGAMPAADRQLPPR
jgi:putative membrane protein